MLEVNGQLIPKNWVGRHDESRHPRVPRPGQHPPAQPQKPGAMKIWHPYRSPANAHHDHKPVRDMSRPLSSLNIYDYALSPHSITQSPISGIFGRVAASDVEQTSSLFGMLSMNQFMQLPEVTPYETTLTTGEIFAGGWMYAQLHMAQRLWNERMAASVNAICNPRTRWAHNTYMKMYYLRGNAAYFATFGMLTYGFEFIYNFVPGFRIADPSPEGYKRHNMDANDINSTWRARWLSILLGVPPGWVLLKGTVRGATNATLLTMAAGMFFEWQKSTGAWSGTVNYMAFRRHQYNEIASKYGSLVPEVHRTIDPDTHLPRQAASADTIYDDVRDYVTPIGLQTASWYRQKLFANDHHDYNPTPRPRIPNPWYDWRKDTQKYKSQAGHVHTDFWNLPNVLSSATLYGNDDKQSLNAKASHPAAYHAYPNAWKTPVVVTPFEKGYAAA